MYQRMVMGASELETKSTAKAENERDREAQPLIDGDEEYAGDKHHHNNQCCRNHGFLARRPSDLGRFGTHRLKELERIRHFSPKTFDLKVKNPMIVMSFPKDSRRGTVRSRATAARL
jgi:hypothetical protein